ncbi:alpha-N-acetylneuraminide alpha-2,8-sialyltransferase-like [Saccoglossus kowalevskii]|uniref:Alpha-N-acetylneuraminide alpha-2,8-sialyltransferase-like n=1 Tax=Saccoglossus kowalevskii TaxID=10224 RepID=A0ABM0H0V8_SACKO|nr:PREDICTED: alpha-N-acetylneuraminide alpha-2,8-sialyltransferase-like [Saccoglossus kowalevskii]
MRKMHKRKVRARRKHLFWIVTACFFCLTTILLLNLYVYSRPTHITNEHNIIKFGEPVQSLSVIVKVIQNYVKHPLGFSDTNSTNPKKIKLQKRMARLVSKLRTWQPNNTRVVELMNDLNSYMNDTHFISTKENTPVGQPYFDTMFNKSVIIDEKKRQLLPNKSPFSNKKFKSCAVVGNGGILRNSGCGKEIDSYDFVIRSNLQQLSGFTYDAGSKVNLTSISQSLLNNYRFDGSYKFVLNFTNVNMTKLLASLEEYDGSLLWIPNSKVSNLAFEMVQLIHDTTTLKTFLYNPEHSAQIQRYWNLTQRSISTGMTLTSVGLSLCEEVHLYGFWPFTFDYKGTNLPMHYTENLLWSTYKKYHDFPSEFVRLIKLHYQGVLRLHVDDCRKPDSVESDDDLFFFNNDTQKLLLSLGINDTKKLWSNEGAQQWRKPMSVLDYTES